LCKPIIYSFHGHTVNLNDSLNDACITLKKL
jgi:hypothetical protein